MFFLQRLSLPIVIASVLFGIPVGIDCAGKVAADEYGRPFVPGTLPQGAPMYQPPHLIVRSPQLHRQQQTVERQHYPLQTSSAATPGAVVQPVWRQPYAYGYFGAQSNRLWNRHYGYQSAFTQWTFK